MRHYDEDAVDSDFENAADDAAYEHAMSRLGYQGGHVSAASKHALTKSPLKMRGNGGLASPDRERYCLFFLSFFSSKSFITSVFLWWWW